MGVKISCVKDDYKSVSGHLTQMHTDVAEVAEVTAALPVKNPFSKASCVTFDSELGLCSGSSEWFFA